MYSFTILSELTGREVYVRLLDSTMCNSIPNVEKAKKEKFPIQERKVCDLVELPTNVCKIYDVEIYVRKQFLKFNDTITLQPNNDTLKCDLNGSLNVNFDK